MIFNHIILYCGLYPRDEDGNGLFTDAKNSFNYAIANVTLILM